MDADVLASIQATEQAAREDAQLREFILAADARNEAESAAMKRGSNRPFDEDHRFGNGSRLSARRLRC